MAIIQKTKNCLFGSMVATGTVVFSASRNPEQRTQVIHVDKNGKETTREFAYLKMLARSEVIRNSGYNLVERWEHEEPRPWWNDKLPPKRNET